MSERKDPWSILGVPRSATQDEIKAQFRKLALALHPDKHGDHLTPEQKKEKEERFKEVSVAYQVAIDIAKARESGQGFENPNSFEDYEKWRGMWERVEEVIRNQNLVAVLKSALKGTLHDMARVAVKRMNHAMHKTKTTTSTTHNFDSDNDSDPNADSDLSSDIETESNHSTPDAPASVPTTDTSAPTSAPASTPPSTDESAPAPHEYAEPRIFKLPVTLDEVHTKASRKLRLFLHEYPKDPIFVHVDFEKFPEMVYHHTMHGNSYKIVIEMVVQKHPVYYWEPSLGGWDLYTTVPITLYEYFMGVTKRIPQLGSAQGSQASQEPLLLHVPAFINMKNPIVYDHIGLRKKGHLYVMLELIYPTKEMWEIWKKKEPASLEEFLRVCKKLENVNAPHRTPS